ncbi:hypothetical protein CJU89_5378 [Yarrowia sp. B02]|nr:hypothetical protein CJU89_5378 [Yarrowia sp. B02]
MNPPASDNEVSLGSVPDIDTFIEAEKTREDATKQTDKEAEATKSNENEHSEVDEFGSNPQDQEQEEVPELEDSIMQEYEVDQAEEGEHEVELQMDAEKAMEVEQPVESALTPQIDTSYDFSDHQETLNLPKKRVPSYLQPTISYSQKVRAKYDPRSVSGSSQRSFSGSRTYSAEYHLREARLYDQRQNEMDVSREGTGSPDSSSTLEIPKRGGSRKQVKREFSREFTPSFPFNKENVN